MEDIIDDMDRAFAEEARGGRGQQAAHALQGAAGPRLGRLHGEHHPGARCRAPGWRRSAMTRWSSGSGWWRGSSAWTTLIRRAGVGASCLLFNLEDAEPLAIIHDFSLVHRSGWAPLPASRRGRCPGRTAGWWGSSVRVTRRCRTSRPSARYGTCARCACTASPRSTGNGSPWR